jgi:HlyD family secretion protein
MIPASLHVDASRALRKAGAKSRWAARSVLLGIAFLVVLSGLWTFRQNRRELLGPHWTSERVHRADVQVAVSATGKLSGLNTVEVGAEVTGKVLRVLVDYNDRVEKGQVLAEIDPELLGAAVDESRAQLLAAKANILTARSTATESEMSLARVEEEAKQGLLAQKDLEAARATAERAEAAVMSALANASLSSASLKSAASRLRKTKIVAPSGGVVLARYIEPGQTVTAGFTTPVLFKLAEDLTKLSLHVNVDEADIGRVREGNDASFTVDAYADRRFPSKVISLRNEPATSQGVVTYEAVLTVDNAEHLLRPGMTATASITSRTVPAALVVPNAALRFALPVTGAANPATAPGHGAKRVFLLMQGQPKAVTLQTGATDGHITEVVSGSLKLGDEVLTDAVVNP